MYVHVLSSVYYIIHTQHTLLQFVHGLCLELMCSLAGFVSMESTVLYLDLYCMWTVGVEYIVNTIAPVLLKLAVR